MPKLNFAMIVILISACGGGNGDSKQATAPNQTSVPATLGTPDNLRAIVNNDDSPAVILEWDYDGAPIEGYFVYRADNQQTITSLRGLEPITAITSKSYTDNQVAKGVTYFYRIQAFKADQVSNLSNIISIEVTAGAASENLGGGGQPPPPAPDDTETVPPPGVNLYPFNGISARPSFFCSLQNIIRIVDVNVPPATELSRGQTYTFVTTIAYSLSTTTTVGFEWRDGIGPSVVESGRSGTMVVEPGCGTITFPPEEVTLDITLASAWQQFYLLPFDGGLPSGSPQWGGVFREGYTVTYPIAGQPRVKIDSIDVPPGSALQTDADGVASVIVKMSWDFQGQPTQSPVRATVNSASYFGTAEPIARVETISSTTLSSAGDANAGSKIQKITFRRNYCNERAVIISAGGGIAGRDNGFVAQFGLWFYAPDAQCATD